MSARITLHCNTLWRDGSCTSQVMTDARTVEEARTAAGRRGWRSHPDGTDYCPPCSGGGPARPVTVLHLHGGTP
ncbi:hypothetical protein [Streptomyces sp. CCM_MD2014]|uniref:hypothetical protein n=1 Tax=Streptomyces sp. CCM_MD2014 TaxID=1561022 RepID=UPI00052A8601|nr:hypothetical protein [Streptomyces sp. CCM_MD2014]AIV35564.1 hypothetical protein NI25_20370 [Streptomyces sp. CCM_MD2014]